MHPKFFQGRQFHDVDSATTGGTRQVFKKVGMIDYMGRIQSRAKARI